MNPAATAAGPNAPAECLGDRQDPACSGGASPIPLLPLDRWQVRLTCLESTRIGLFPEAALASLLMAAQAAHKDRVDALSLEVTRSAQHHFLPGELFEFVLLATRHDAARRDAVFQLLRGLPASAPRRGEGCAFADNWRFASAETLSSAQELDYAAIRAEAAEWTPASRFRIRFVSPLRIKAARKDARGRVRYCRQEADVDDAALSLALLNSLVSLKFAFGLRDWNVPEMPLHIRRKELFLIDPGRRSETRDSKPLDEGLLGEVVVEWVQAPTPEQWQHLVLLQYLGVGQGRAFGLGRMQLETLAGERTKTVLPSPHRALALAADERNVALAYEHVRRGSDLTSWPELKDRLDESDADGSASAHAMLAALSKHISAAAVIPSALFPLSLPKPDGGQRELLIPSFTDRVAQRAVLQTIEPALDALFAKTSYGFRRGLGREAARDRIQTLQRQGFTVVAETDIRRFFDEVAWWRVETRLRCLFGQEPLIDQIMRWLEAVRRDGVERVQGLPQGAALSPILANLMLDHLDRVLMDCGGHPVRFADDLVILCRNRGVAEAALELTATVLADTGLRLKLEKTRITDFSAGFRFLGYQFVESLAVPVSKENEPAFELPDELRLLLTPPPEPSAEMHALNSTGEEPGLLLVVNEQGCRLSLDGGRLELKRPDGHREHYPFPMLSAVLVMARAQLSTELIKAAMRANVPLHFLSGTGQWQGSTAGEADGSTIALWQAQQQRTADPAFQLSFARQLVAARLHSMTVVLAHRRAAPTIIDTLRQSHDAAERAADLAVLRGIEGHGTARYFAALDDLLPFGFDFRSRTRRPPRDPVNALLSFGYTLLHQAAHAVLTASQLNPRIGIYHQPRGTHAALASDFIEPFRFIVERQVLSQINRREIKPADFSQRGDGACLLGSPARGRFVLAMHERFQQPLRALYAERACGLYGHLQAQAESLKRALKADAPVYVPRFR